MIDSPSFSYLLGLFFYLRYFTIHFSIFSWYNLIPFLSLIFVNREKLLSFVILANCEVRVQH